MPCGIVIRRRRRELAVGLVAALLAACQTPPWDQESLELAYPDYAAVKGHRLGDVTPYLLATRGTLALFLCRWPTGEPITVSLPPDASRDELEPLRAALRAWERMGLGVSFREVPRGGAGVDIHLEEGAAQRPRGPATGSAVVDCAVAPSGLDPTAPSPLPARGVRAVVRIARKTPPDLLGEERSLTPAETAAAALHEIGHALGFQGHVRFGDSPLSQEPERVIALGERVLAGRSLRAPEMEALYALPSGVILRRDAIEPWRSEDVDALARRAAAGERGLVGPITQVGDVLARIYWLDADGLAYGFQIRELRAVVRGAEPPYVLPERRTRALLSP